MEEVLKHYKEANDIAQKVLEFSKKIITKDKKILEIANQIEKKIFELGAKPAWPVNISINEIAAHYTPARNDERRIKINELIKIDFGIHINGYISDNAFTVCIEKENELIKAAEKALENALKIIKPGIKVMEISETIYSTLQSFEVKPIINLCGHSIERYCQHGKISIPNIPNKIETQLEKGQIIAIEVFTTNGSGWVKESWPANIFQFKQRKPIRNNEARKILELAEKKFEKLPFTPRWIKEVPEGRIDFAISQLVNANALIAHPTLKEENGIVAVAEKTIII